MARASYRVREWAVAGSYQVLVHAFEEEWLDVPSTWGSRQPDAAPGPSTRLCSIDVEYVNPTLDESLNCRRNQWFLYDDAGYNYEAEPSDDRWYRARGRPFLGGDRQLNPGQHLRGWLAFRVPAEARITRVQFLTSIFNSFVADVTLDPPADTGGGPYPPHAASALLAGPAELYEQQIITCVHGWAAALARRDTAWLDALLDADFSAITTQGLLLDRAAYLGAAAAGRLLAPRFTVADIDVLVFGSVAVARCLVEEATAVAGEASERLVRQLHVYHYGDGRWRLAVMQATQAL